MTNTKTTAALLATLTAHQLRRVTGWCRRHEARLAAMPASDRQKALREQIAVAASVA
jgi:hypothetical protein